MSEKGGTPARRRHLELECLEERIAPVGNVTVSVSGGNLTLTGDSEANQFMIDHSGLGLFELRVTPGGGTTLNGGASELIVSGVKGIKMNLGDGDDSAVLNGITLAKDVIVDTGGGVNSVVVTSATTIGGALTVKSSSAAWSQDHLEINGCDVLRNVSLTTKMGGQTVFIAGCDIGGSISMKIAHMDGDGNYLVQNSAVGGSVSLAIGQGYHVLGSDPDDSIPFRIQGSQVKSVAVQAKGGDYSFAFIDSETSMAKKGGIAVSYGSGDSYTYIGDNSTVYGSVSVKSGTSYTWWDRLWNVAWDTEFTLEGDSLIYGKLSVGNLDSDDSVTVLSSQVLQGISVSNGTGDATVNLLGVTIGKSGDKTYASKIATGSSGWGFEDDTVSLAFDEVLSGPLALSMGSQSATLDMRDLDVTGSLSVTTGANSDTIYLKNMVVTKNVTIKTGAGDDAVHIFEHSSPQGALSIDTGAGNDQLYMDDESSDCFSTYYGKVKVTLGAGDDQMWVGNGAVNEYPGHYYKGVTFDGGAGTDAIVYLGNGNIFDVPAVILFETEL